MTAAFRALQGRQGRSTFYTAVMTLGELLDVLPAPDGSAAPERRAQRSLSESRAHGIADYLQLDDWTLPPVTISCSRIDYADSMISIPPDAQVLCSDGQHRRRAIEIALSENPALAGDAITVVLHESASLEEAQQRFADLNSGQPAARSVKLLYDIRSASPARAVALAPPFEGLVEMQLGNASPQSDKLWTLSGLDRTPNITRTGFWTDLLGRLPALAELHAEAATAKDLRKQFVWAHNVGLQGIGFVAEKIAPEDLAKVDWSRANKEWEGRAQAGRRMLAPRKNAILIANLLLRKHGLPLPPQFRKVEDAATMASSPHAVIVPSALPEAAAAAKAPAVIRPRMSLDLGEWSRLLGSGPFAYGDVPSFAGISGGRTSAMMAALLDPRVRLCFENTGREDERTLVFLERLAEGLGREIVWLEWRPPKRKGAPPKEFGFEIVDFRTACRDGSVFEACFDALADFRATKGLGPIVPFHSQRTCTAYLKHRVQRAYMRSLGVDLDDDQIQYIGLRADEPKRLADLRAAETQARCYLTPLADAGVSKPNVGEFWSRQSFDLELPHDRNGNCAGCFEKDDADLSRVLGEETSDAAWWIRMQTKFPGFGGRDKNSYAQLLMERPTRLAIEASLRAGTEPEDDGRLTPRRFRLVVQNEQIYLKREMASFSCACEASLVQSAREEVDED